MIITGIIKRIQDDETDNSDLQKGILQLAVDNPAMQADVEYAEFKRLLKECEQTIAPDKDVVAPGSNPLAIKPEKTDRPDYSKLIHFLSDKLCLNNHSFEDVVVVESDSGDFLKIPWEKLSKDLCVIRKVISDKQANPPEDINKVIILVSFADRDSNGEIGKIKELVKEETKRITESLLDAEPKNLFIQSIKTIKHTTQKYFETINWDDYNIAHFIMHATNKGELCFECDSKEKYKESDPITQEQFIKLLAKENFLLLYLSTCNSGGSINGESLAYLITYNGISKYAIGYNNGIKESFATYFADKFYNLYTIRNNSEKNFPIEEIYKETIADYYTNDSDRWKFAYIPTLYKNG